MENFTPPRDTHTEHAKNIVYIYPDVVEYTEKEKLWEKKWTYIFLSHVLLLNLQLTAGSSQIKQVHMRLPKKRSYLRLSGIVECTEKGKR